MTEQLQLRRGTAAQVAAFTGAQGEVVVDTTNQRLVVNDGATAGGWPADICVRTAVADAAYSALVTDRIVAYTAITAARAVSLPSAASYPTGTALWIVDESGACSPSKTITVGRAGSDLIDGAVSFAISAAYAGVELESNGSNAWTILSPAPNLQASLIGVATAPDPNNPLSVYGAAALFNGPASMNVTVNKNGSGNTASVIFEDGFSARAQIGLCGDDNFHFKVSPNGSTFLDALDINATTGQISFPYGAAEGEAVGFRNRLRNGSFAINQRGVSGTVTLAAGQYGHDGVKGGASGCTYTFSTSGVDTTLTISAGSLILPIESSLIEGGSYTVSNAGTAQARVWQGTGSTGSGSYASAPASPATAPLTVTGLAAATQTNVEFATGTVLRPQFEMGAVATLFERRPPGFELALCQRYYEQSSGLTGVGGTPLLVAVLTSVVQGFAFTVPKRAAPTVVLYSRNGTSGKLSSCATGADVGSAATANSVSASRVYSITDASAPYAVGGGYEANYTATAEI